MYAYICILCAEPGANDNLVKMKPVDINTGGYNTNGTTFLKNFINDDSYLYLPVQFNFF